MPIPKNYTTRRLSLRPLKRSDYAAWLSSQETCLPKQDKFDKDPLPVEKRTKAFFNKSVAKHVHMAKTDESYIWNVFLKRTGELIGWIDVSTIARRDLQIANLGYFVINIHRRRGYAREAVNKIIEVAFQDLQFHRLEAVTDLDNRGSVAVAKSCGLISEGIRKHYWFQNNRWEDQRVFAITPELHR